MDGQADEAALAEAAPAFQADAPLKRGTAEGADDWGGGAADGSDAEPIELLAETMDLLADSSSSTDVEEVLGRPVSKKAEKKARKREAKRRAERLAAKAAARTEQQAKVDARLRKEAEEMVRRRLDRAERRVAQRLETRDKATYDATRDLIPEIEARVDTEDAVPRAEEPPDSGPGEEAPPDAAAEEAERRAAKAERAARISAAVDSARGTRRAPTDGFVSFEAFEGGASAAWPPATGRERGRAADGGGRGAAEADAGSGLSTVWQPPAPAPAAVPDFLGKKTCSFRHLPDEPQPKGEACNEPRIVVAHFARFVVGRWQKFLLSGKRAEAAQSVLAAQTEATFQSEKKFRETIKTLKPLMRMLRYGTIKEDVLKHLVSLSKLAAGRRYKECGEVYMQLTVGKRTWHASHPLAKWQQNHGGSIRKIIRPSELLDYDKDPVTNAYIRAFKRLVQCHQLLFPPADLGHMF